VKKNSYYIYVSFLIWVVTTSCQKVVDIDLNASNPALVIEAYLSDQSLDTVFLSKTVNYDELNIFPPVSGATVKISDDSGNIYILPEILPGTYVASGIAGVPGRSYSLEIITAGITYSSASTMPEPVQIDSLFLQTGYFGDRNLNIRFNDAPGIDNYYRLVYRINRSTDKSIHIADDGLRDGEDINYSIHLDNEEGIPGDTITVYLQCIDKQVYDYFRTLLQLRRGGQSAAPANPLSNISSDVLGYFSAYSVRSKALIIK
jgi:hypothetical protein